MLVRVQSCAPNHCGHEVAPAAEPEGRSGIQAFGAPGRVSGWGMAISCWFESSLAHHSLLPNEEDEVSKVVRGVRLDLTIAVCALLISTLAAGASWWQARVLQAQTRVLEDQLGAQVWPYVSVSEGINNDTVAISVAASTCACATARLSRAGAG